LAQIWCTFEYGLKRGPKAHMTVIIDWLGNTRVVELSLSFKIVFRP